MTGAQTTSTTDRRPPLGWVLALTSMAYFMVALDALVVVTALPRMQQDLHVGLSSLQWTVNSYGIAFAAGIITAAALGDRFGRRRVFNVGLVLFTAASAACALAPSAGVLIAARTVQGLGGAIVLPLSLTILTTAFPAERRGLIVGIYGGLAGLAVAIGPLVGGAVTQGIDWQWIFWINVPIGLAAAALATRLLPESYGTRKPLDPGGLVLVTGGVLALVWGMVRANDTGWSSPEVIAALAGGVALLVAFVVWEGRVAAPMMPLRLFRSREFSFGNVTTFMMSGATFSAAFMVTQEFQFARGYSPLSTGLRLLPFFATPMFVAPIAGAVSDRVGRRPLIVTGLTLQTIGFAWVAARGSLTTSWVELALALLVAGVGISMALPDRSDRRPQLRPRGGDGDGLWRQLHGPALRRGVRGRDRHRRLLRLWPPRLSDRGHGRLQTGHVGVRGVRPAGGARRPRDPLASRSGATTRPSRQRNWSRPERRRPPLRTTTKGNSHGRDPSPHLDRGPARARSTI